MTAKPDMRVDIGGIQLQNPVMTASGTFGYGREFDHLIDLNRLGGIIVKGLSLLPTKGNPPPRIVETACGMINAIGLENVGIESFIAEKLPFLQDLKPPLMVNIYGKVVEDYRQLAARIDEVAAIDGIEVNISCPNVKAGGMAFGTDPQAAYDVVRAVRSQTSKLVIVKLSPNVTDVTEIASAVEEAGADCISLINTISAMAVDANTRRPKIANIIGGLSGPAIKPVALRMVWQVARKSKLPIIGIGGIMTAEDALEFLITGATAIQVGTANFVNPRTTVDIIEGIEAFLADQGIASVMDIVGTLET